MAESMRRKSHRAPRPKQLSLITPVSPVLTRCLLKVHRWLGSNPFCHVASGWLPRVAKEVRECNSAQIPGVIGCRGTDANQTAGRQVSKPGLLIPGAGRPLPVPERGLAICCLFLPPQPCFSGERWLSRRSSRGISLKECSRDSASVFSLLPMDK